MHSAFAYYLSRGLKGEADLEADGIVDLKELWNYLKFKIKKATRKAGKLQSPVLKSSVNRNIPLTINPKVHNKRTSTREINNTEAPIVIEDKALRREIGKRVSKIKGEPIYKSDVSSIKQLKLGGRKITDIKPLENFTNLKKLNLYSNKIIDISPLKNLTDLEDLNLNDNSLADISPLKNLTNLEKLKLYNNHINDISPLQGLINLDELNLNANNITDIEPLKNLVKLEKLRLYQNNISDINPLSNLINLVVLRLDNNNITDIRPLKNLFNLKYLYLRGNNIMSGNEIIGELIAKGVKVKV